MARRGNKITHTARAYQIQAWFFNTRVAHVDYLVFIYRGTNRCNILHILTEGTKYYSMVAFQQHRQFVKSTRQRNLHELEQEKVERFTTRLIVNNTHTVDAETA